MQDSGLKVEDQDNSNEYDAKSVGSIEFYRFRLTGNVYLVQLEIDGYYTTNEYTFAGVASDKSDMMDVVASYLRSLVEEVETWNDDPYRRYR